MNGWGQYWSWAPGEGFPSFRLCLSCKVYICSQWGSWRAGGVHSCGSRLTAVIQGYPPPPNYEPDLPALEALAAIAKEWET